jgi:2-polyprenyl-3-methyl-5-hydroxy-6-metoxy-1,4-benzoquinol methylase
MSAEELRCEVCGSRQVERAFTARDRNRNIDERDFAIMRCAECGLGFTIPKLSAAELSRYYTYDYYSLDNSLELEEATRPHNQKRVERIRRFIPTGKLLDVGAGTGMFVKTAMRNGFDAEGLEISADAAAFGRKHWNLTITQGNLHEMQLPAATFDVVTLGHVFEHLHEPQQAAAQLHALLKPKGLLVIAVPNFVSIQARLFRSRWFHLDAPRHLVHYSPRNLTGLMERTGFSVVDMNFFSAEHNWAGILGSVMQLSRPHESFVHKLVRKSIGVPIARMLAVLEAALGRGGTFELYAIKQ